MRAIRRRVFVARVIKLADNLGYDEMKACSRAHKFKFNQGEGNNEYNNRSKRNGRQPESHDGRQQSVDESRRESRRESRGGFARADDRAANREASVGHVSLGGGRIDGRVSVAANNGQ